MEPENRRQRPATAPNDEAAADSARSALRYRGAVPIEPDAPIAVMLAPGERVLAARRATRIGSLSGASGTSAGAAGDLYLTDRRLIHLSEPGLDILLEDIREAGVTEDQLLLLVGAEGVRIRIDDPRVLRVHIGAARTARRAALNAVRRSQSKSR